MLIRRAPYQNCFVYFEYPNCFNITTNQSPSSARIKSLAPPPEKETVLPGALWIGVSTLFGSILSRPRALPIRLLVPPTFFFVSANYFLPLTTSNVLDYVTSLEKRFIPDVAKRQEELVKDMRGSVDSGLKSVGRVRESVVEGVDWAAGKLQDTTGLKFKEDPVKKKDV